MVYAAATDQQTEQLELTEENVEKVLDEVGLPPNATICGEQQLCYIGACSQISILTATGPALSDVRWRKCGVY